LAAKAAKTTTTPVGEKKAKVEKEKKAEDIPFVNTTPKGEKKGERLDFFTRISYSEIICTRPLSADG